MGVAEETDLTDVKANIVPSSRKTATGIRMAPKMAFFEYRASASQVSLRDEGFSVRSDTDAIVA